VQGALDLTLATVDERVEALRTYVQTELARAPVAERSRHEEEMFRRKTSAHAVRCFSRGC
jgi:hypothetical protein